MKAILQTLADAIRDSRSVAYCRLVETRGSTPQKAGAMMLVYPDGSQSGTLGGGCVEAEVKRRAIALLAVGGCEIQTFQLNSDYGWDDGLICGGRMKILIESVTGQAAVDYFAKLNSVIAAGNAATEAVVLTTKDTVQDSPPCYLFDGQQNLIATHHAPSAKTCPPHIQETLRPLDTQPQAYAHQNVAYLPILSRCQLLIVGGGHVGQAVASLAADLNFDVAVVDDREDIVSAERFPRATQRIAGPVEQVLPEFPISPHTYCLIVTRGHNHDERALYYLAERGAAYVGLIGSRRKIRMIFDDLIAEGVAAERLENVYAPVGLDIGSQTVPEIAVSICAELIAHRNCQGHVAGRPEAVVCNAAN
ncbi:MAG: XdhC family protein [Pirellulaceae bacterium]|nr:XdhC family protein [Pirellulaceae bacterium]